MALYNTAGNQYTAVTGKKRNFPYRAFIEAQVPTLYQSKARQENNTMAQAQLNLESQTLEESKRASEASLNESIRASGIQAGLQREQMEQEEKQAKIGAVTSGAQTAGLGYYAGTKLGLWGGSAAATGAKVAGTSAAHGMAAGTTAGATTASSSSGLIGAGLSYAGPVAGGFVGGKLGSKIATSIFGESELAEKGGGVAGGAASGAAIGSFIPGVGPAIGGVIGGVAGLLGVSM